MTLVNSLAALDTPEDFEDRMDCARKVLEGVDAEVMVALIWEEETRESERFISTLIDCIPIQDGYMDVEDEHADWIRDATIVEVEHSLVAASDYESDVDFFAFVAEEGTIYQIGAGLGTLENASITLYGPFPNYEELYIASSYKNGENLPDHQQILTVAIHRHVLRLGARRRRDRRLLVLRLRGQPA